MKGSVRVSWKGSLKALLKGSLQWLFRWGFGRYLEARNATVQRVRPPSHVPSSRQSEQVSEGDDIHNETYQARNHRHNLIARRKIFTAILGRRRLRETKDTIRVYGWKFFQECLVIGSSKVISSRSRQKEYQYQTSSNRSEGTPAELQEPYLTSTLGCP